VHLVSHVEGTLRAGTGIQDILRALFRQRPINNMDSLIFHNDHLLPLEEARLSPGQIGLLMGWGVFTTLRIYEGVPFAFDRHWARMAHDADRLGVTLDYRQGEVWEAVVKLAAANRRPEAMARLYFVKNQGGLWAQAPALRPTDLLILTRELVAWPATQKLKLTSNIVFSGGKLAGAKMLSWVQNVGTLEGVHTEGFDDALLVNEQGHLAECTSANIFLVRDGQVLTPPLSSGCLPGITRDVLREVIPAAGYKLLEQDLTPDDLDSAAEVFITSTTREVAAVGSIHPNWSYAAPGPITRALAAAFQQYVRSHLPRAAARRS
jgi:branched-chain amino acid aminotransferase